MTASAATLPFVRWVGNGKSRETCPSMSLRLLPGCTVVGPSNSGGY